MKMIPPPLSRLNILRYIQPINVNNKINHIFPRRAIACAHFFMMRVCLIISYQMQK
jgi:hypothetical protein